MKLDERIDRNVQLGPYSLQGKSRKAAQYLFSFLAEVEEIAVLAAKRGDGIRDQLEDEISHRDSFAAIADRLGGRVDVGTETKDLIAFLEALRGAESLALLNVVCESWLEGIFSRLAAAGFCSELFATVEAEECRHALEARNLERPSPREALPLVRSLEALLAEVATAPCFIVPLQFLIGARETALMGLANIQAHKLACVHLEVPPGERIRDLEKSCRAVFQSESEPTPIEMNDWEKSKFIMWSGPAPMQIIRIINLETPNPAEQEARVVFELGQILSRNPRLNRTIRDSQIYEPSNIKIGVRRAHDKEGEQITTVYVDNPQRKTLEEIQQEIKRKTLRMQQRVYRPIRDYRKVLDLLPAPRTSAVVTHVGKLGIEIGWAPFVPDEGATISVCIGKAKPRTNVNLGILLDHRAGDGKEIGALWPVL